MTVIANFFGGCLIGIACYDSRNKWRLVPALIGSLIEVYVWYNIGAANVVCGG